ILKGVPAPTRTPLAVGLAECALLLSVDGQISCSSASAAPATPNARPAMQRAQYRRDDEPERSMSGRIIITDGSNRRASRGDPRVAVTRSWTFTRGAFSCVE